MTFKIVPVIGSARHGKDTIAEFLLEHNYCRVALADEVKLDCAAMYGLQFPEFLVDFDEEGRIFYPHDTQDPDRIAFRRRTWQVWGTEGRRSIFPDIWLWRWANRFMIHFHNKKYRGVVIPDVRFFNEAVHFKAMGASIVSVVRTDREGNPYQEPGIDYRHPSEVDIQRIIYELSDIAIKNSGSLLDLDVELKITMEMEDYI
jgi:hypothetical protein